MKKIYNLFFAFCMLLCSCKEETSAVIFNIDVDYIYNPSQATEVGTFTKEFDFYYYSNNIIDQDGKLFIKLCAKNTIINDVKIKSKKTKEEIPVELYYPENGFSYAVFMLSVPQKASVKCKYNCIINYTTVCEILDSSSNCYYSHIIFDCDTYKYFQVGGVSKTICSSYISAQTNSPSENE